MQYSTEAIVIKSTPYGEADLIVTYLTKDFGLINLFAKSPRKIKSRFGSSLEPLTHSRISFIGREENLQRIIQSDIIRSFQNLRENFSLFLKICDILRLLIHIVPHREPHPELFSLILATAHCLENKNKAANYLLYLKVQTLNILGYFPDFRNCGICRRTLFEKFFYSQGFIVCERCLKEKELVPKPLTKGVIKILKELSSWKIEFLERVKISSSLIDEAERFLQIHTQTILGYNKSWHMERNITTL